MKSENVKLEHITKITTGRLNSNAYVENGKYPFFTCNPITLRTNTFSFDTEAVLLAGNNASGDYTAKYFCGKFDVYQRTYVIQTANEEVLLVRYLGYAIEQQLLLLKMMSAGSTTKFLTIKMLHNLRIPLPPLPIQKQIAEILSNYDDLIENNQKQIKLLEEAAERLYKEWFIYLRFPEHENVEIIDGVPKGWVKIALNEAIEFNPTIKLNKDDVKKLIPMSALNINSMTVDKSLIQSTNSNSGSKFENGDTLLARITPCLENGKTAFVYFLDENEKAVGSTEYIVMRSKLLNPYLVYCIARSEWFRSSAINSMVGATGRQRVQSSIIEKLEYVLPSTHIVLEFEKQVKPIFEQVKLLVSQIDLLRQARDKLLPRLISGEIDVG